MSVARDLVKLESQLRQQSQIDLFDPADNINFLSSPEASPMLGQLKTLNLSNPSRILRLCLQALRVQHHENMPKLIDAEFVATLPIDAPSNVRQTKPVIQEMLERPVTEVIAIGYEFTDQEVVQLLAKAATRGVSVIVICDRERGCAQRIIDAWPQDASHPKLFHDRDRSEGAIYASMHAKCLLVDSKDLLITSANFTFHGLQGNIEFGVRLSGAPAVEARKIFSYLVQENLVEEVLWPV